MIDNNMGWSNKTRVITGFVLIFISMEFLSLSKAYKFFVGGKEGWVLNPSENFDHWAQRNRFQVNDTLFFKYKQGSESVLVVKKEDYYSCNTNNPIKSLTGGDSVLLLDRSGAFYFIAGAAADCQKGLRLHLVVMAVRTKPSPPAAPAVSPTPEQRVDPSALEDAPAPAPGKNHRSAAGRAGVGLGLALVMCVGLILFN